MTYAHYNIGQNYLKRTNLSLQNKYEHALERDKTCLRVQHVFDIQQYTDLKIDSGAKLK